MNASRHTLTPAQRREYLTTALEARRERIATRHAADQKLQQATDPINKAYAKAAAPLHHALAYGGQPEEIAWAAFDAAIKELSDKSFDELLPHCREYRITVRAADDKFEAAVAAAFYQAQEVMAT